LADQKPEDYIEPQRAWMKKMVAVVLLDVATRATSQ
jgi:hypothetical protein